MCHDIDLARVGITDNARDRWAEWIGLPDWRLRYALAASRPANRRLRRRVREGFPEGGRWHFPTLVRVNRSVGAVFLIGLDRDRSSGHGSPWNLVTVLPLDACRVGPEVAELGQEGELCAVGSQ